MLAVAGIGNPNNFFNLLNENKLNVEKISFPDHYNFSKSEIIRIIEEGEKNKLKIIMTEKDFLRIKNLNLDNIKYLKISLEIENRSLLLNKIKSYMIKFIKYLVQSIFIYLFFIIGRLIGLDLSRKIFSKSFKFWITF